MLKKRKADAMTDWAISLAIFLLYLAWFFVFVRPVLVYEEKPDMAAMANDFVEDSINWEVYKYPVYIRTNYSGLLANEPIIAFFPYDFNETNSYVINKSFFISDRHFFLVKDTIENTVLYLIKTDETYPRYYEASDLAATAGSVSTGTFTASFNNGLLTSTSKINSFAIKINDVALSTANNDFSDEIVAAQYSVKTQAVNHTTYVFKGNPRIYGIISPAQPLQTKLEFNIDDYKNYYANALYNGAVPYPSGCRSFTSDRINFYSNSTNLLFVFNKPVSIELCADNATVDVDFEFTSANQTLYRAVEFSGDYMNYERYYNPYITSSGVRETVEGISMIKLLALSVSNFNLIKKNFGLGNFRLEVSYGAENITLGPNPPGFTNVYVDEYKAFIVDKFGNLEKATVNIKSWS